MDDLVRSAQPILLPISGHHAELVSVGSSIKWYPLSRLTAMLALYLNRIIGDFSLLMVKPGAFLLKGSKG